MAFLGEQLQLPASIDSGSSGEQMIPARSAICGHAVHKAAVQWFVTFDVGKPNGGMKFWFAGEAI